MNHRLRIILGTIAILMVVSLPAALAQSGSFGDSDRSQPRSYQLTITANVRNADVYIDGVRQRETTPATFRLRPGTYTVRVEARGYRSWQRRVTLDSNETIRAQLLPPTATVLLEIPSQFLNDRVRDPWRLIDFYIDGRLRSDSRIEVEAGYHDVTIISGGLRMENEFYFEAGRTYTVELIMRLSIYQSARY